MAQRNNDRSCRDESLAPMRLYLIKRNRAARVAALLISICPAGLEPEMRGNDQRIRPKMP